MPEATETPKQAEAALPAGTKVEVRTGFDRSWAQGFVVEEWSAEGYVVRRRSDGEVLPARFCPTDVRKERKNSMWWV